MSTKEKLQILVVFDTAGMPPADQNFEKALKNDPDWKSERHVVNALKECGHHVRTAGIYDNIAPLLKAVERQRPDLIFNMVEDFNAIPHYDRNVAGLFELLGIAYTGTAPNGLMLCRNKGTAKKILSHHHIQTPAFHIYPRDRRPSPPKKLTYPLIVKPLGEESSYGLARSSVVENDRDLMERVCFLHENMDQDALVEKFIEGRELYVSLLGNRKLQVFPIREMIFGRLPEGKKKFATFKAKWNEKYRRRWGIQNRFAPLSSEIENRIFGICKKVYRLLCIRGYGRIDLRLTPSNDIVVLEANPNPFIAKDEDFALAAQKGGMSYNTLIQKIVQLGLQGS